MSALRHKSAAPAAPEPAKEDAAPAPEQPGARKKATPLAFAASLLCTGTLMAVMGQQTNQMAPTEPSAQLLAWVRYASTFAVSALLKLREPAGRPAPTAQVQRLVLAVGALDVLAYCCYMLGFAFCGSAALATVVMAACAQFCTAMLSVVVLKKRLELKHFLAVALVSVGMCLRGWPAPGLSAKADRDTGSNNSSSWQSSQLAGVAFVAIAAFLYSWLGVLYEYTLKLGGASLSPTEVAFRCNAVGLAIMSIYQAIYTWPRRDILVLQPLQASGISMAHVLQLHAAFGAVFTLHYYVQSAVFMQDGALAVAVINALRASVVSVATSLLFCTPVDQRQCLTRASGASAAIVTCGALLWVNAGKPGMAQQPQVVADKKEL